MVHPNQPPLRSRQTIPGHPDDERRLRFPVLLIWLRELLRVADERPELREHPVFWDQKQRQVEGAFVGLFEPGVGAPRPCLRRLGLYS